MYLDNLYVKLSVNILHIFCVANSSRKLTKNNHSYLYFFVQIRYLNYLTISLNILDLKLHINEQ